MATMDFDSMRTSVLFGSVGKNNVDQVNKILSSDCFDVQELNRRDKFGRSVLFYAENPVIAKMLIHVGIDVLQRDEKGKKALNVVTNPEAKAIIKQSMAVEREQYIESLPELCKAVIKNDFEKVSQLVYAGIDMYQSDIDGNTPLILALMYGYCEIAQFLIENGADVNYVNKKWVTALHCAKTAKEIELLINYGATIDARTEKGHTPLCCVVMGREGQNEVERAKTLIKYGADVNAKDNEGRTPLHLARDKDIRQFLIENGADVNIKDNNGNTPKQVWDNMRKEIENVEIPF